MYYRQIGPTEDRRISMDMDPNTVPIHDPTGSFVLSLEDIAGLDAVSTKRGWFHEKVEHIAAKHGVTFGTVHASYQVITEEARGPAVRLTLFDKSLIIGTLLGLAAAVAVGLFAVL